MPRLMTYLAWFYIGSAGGLGSSRHLAALLASIPMPALQARCSFAGTPLLGFWCGLWRTEPSEVAYPSFQAYEGRQNTNAGNRIRGALVLRLRPHCVPPPRASFWRRPGDCAVLRYGQRPDGIITGPLERSVLPTCVVVLKGGPRVVPLTTTTVMSPCAKARR